MRILIAAAATSRCTLETVLIKWKYEVISLADGTEAWETM